MPRETNAALQARLSHILAGLRRAYPDARCELNHANPLELLVATILSAQCTDKMVNRVTESLFRKYPTVHAYAAADAGELERDIQSLGFFRNKAKSLRACCQKLVARHAGEVPRTLEELTQLDGVGRKTANVVLGNAFGIDAGVVVDTHVARLAGRLGLTTEKQPEKIERVLMRLVSREDWTRFSHWLIWHGRRRCGARRPDCGGCEVRAWCPSIDPRAQPTRSRQSEGGEALGSPEPSRLERGPSCPPTGVGVVPERAGSPALRSGSRPLGVVAGSEALSARPALETWFCLHDGAHPAAFNMAMDEALLEAAPTLGSPLLRFYGWTEAAATFGYSQRYAEIALLTPLRPLVRRPTGGGLVPHDGDFTYTLVAPPTHEWYGLRARESYRRVHDWLRRAFNRLGWRTELAAVARTRAPGQCFLGAEQFDVLWQGAKIAGAAQRRTRSGLLIQGSIQPPPKAPGRDGWPAAMMRVAEEDWSVRWIPWEISAAARARAGQLTIEKYGHAGYNQRR